MTSLYTDNTQQYIYIDTDKASDVPEELVERYSLALLEWEAVQDDLYILAKENNIV